MESKFCPPKDPLMPLLGKAVKVGYLKNKFEKAIGKILQRPEITVRDIRIEYFHYKPQVNCRIVYRIFLETGEELVAWGKVTPLAQKEKKNKGKWYRFLPALHMTLRLLPSDKVLPGLKYVMNPKWLSHHRGYFLPYEELRGAAIKAGATKIRVINYRAMFRCLLRIDVVLRQEGSAREYTFFAKVFSQSLPAGWLRSMEAISETAENSRLLVPPITGYIEKKRILFSQAVSGSPLLEILGKADERKLMKRLCHALRIIHSVSSDHLDIRGPSLELSDLESCVFSLQGIDNELGILAGVVLQDLYRQVFYLAGWPQGTVHGDFSHEQVFVKNGRILILDYDRLACGDFRSDLGNFIANMLEAHLAGKLEKTRTKEYIKTFVRAYNHLLDEPLDYRVLRWHTAAALLKLAIRPLRRAEAEWKKRARKILAFANRMLEGDYDYLFPIKITKEHTPGKSIPLALIEEMRSAENKKSLLLPRVYAGRVLKKIWPQKNGSWLLLFIKDSKTIGAEPVYGKLSVTGDKRFYIFPEDNLLKKLPDAVNSEKIRKKLREKAPDEYKLADKITLKKIKILSYKPEYRCQLEYTIKTGMPGETQLKLFAKVLRKSGESSRLCDAVTYFMSFLSESRGDIFQAHLKPFLISEINAVFLPHIAGKGFNEILRDKAPDTRVVENIAEGLSVFHGSPYNPSRTHFWEDEIRIMTQWTSQAVQLFPVIADDASRLLEQIIQKGNAIKDRVKAPVHRDFYDKQIMVFGDKVTFIDFDSLVLGDPAIDVGNFIAHLKLRGIQSKGNPEHFSGIKRRFTNTYLKHAQMDSQESIILYTSAALLRLACVYLFRPGGWRLFFPLIREAAETIKSI